MTKIKKVQQIRADAVKLVSQQHEGGSQSSRIQSNQGLQLVSLVKNSGSNALHRKSLKVVKAPASKIKSQVEFAFVQKQEPVSFHENSVTKNLLQQSVQKKEPSFHGEAPLDEVPPQMHTSMSGDLTRDMLTINRSQNYRMEESKAGPMVRHQRLGTPNKANSDSTSGAKVRGATNNKDSSNFNDIEEKQQQELHQNDDSGWFTNHRGSVHLLDSSPTKVMQSQDSGHEYDQMAEVMHSRGLTASNELNKFQKPLYLKIKEESAAPLIKRMPDSNISQKSRKHHSGHKITGESSNRASQPSERFSELTDEHMAAAGVTGKPLMLASLESLNSNESQTSLKNVFSQSQPIANIAARYINIQDSANKNSLESQKLQLSAERDFDLNSGRKNRQVIINDDKGTPRFTKASKGKQKVAVGKKRSIDYYPEQKNFAILQQSTASDKKLKTSLKSIKVPEDQLSGTHNDNSISNLEKQQDMKSLMGILQKHHHKTRDMVGSRIISSSSNQHQKLQAQPPHLKQNNTKMQQMLKLTDSLYPGQQAAPQAQPMTPSGTTNAMLISGFGSAVNSQQSKSFNVVMQGMSAGNNNTQKKKIVSARAGNSQNASMTQGKQHSGLLKNTFARVLQQKSQQQQAIKAQQALHQQQESVTAQKIQLGAIGQGGNGAQSHREKRNFQMLISSTNAKNGGTAHGDRDEPKIIHQSSKIKKKVSGGGDITNQASQLQLSQQSNSKLAQKQLSQTIRFTGISSGISPKASGDMPVDLNESNRGASMTFFKKVASAKAIKIPTNQPAKLTSGLSHLAMLNKQESSEIRDSQVKPFVIIGQEELPGVHQQRNKQHGVSSKKQVTVNNNRVPHSSASPHRVKDTSPRLQQKFLKEDEGRADPVRVSTEFNNQKLTQFFPSKIKKHQIENIQMAIRKEKAAQKDNNLNKQVVKDTAKDGQPFQLYQSSKPSQDEEGATIEDDEENGDEDNISETMQTIPQSTQKSTHPVAYFNESHPTQKIQAMAMMKGVQSGSRQQALLKANFMQDNSPGGRLVRANQVSQQHMRNRQQLNLVTQSSSDASLTEIGDHRQNFKLPVTKLDLEKQWKNMMTWQPKEGEQTPEYLLRAESIQSLSNVVDRDPHPINRINRSNGSPIVNQKAQMRNNQLKFLQSSRKIPTIERQAKRPLIVILLEDGILCIIMQYLPIRRVLPLISVLKAKSLSKREGLLECFEREFLRYLNSYRCGDPNIGGKASKLCRLATMYYLSTLELTRQQEDVFSRVAYKLRFGRISLKTSHETGIGFEIEKDVDRTFIDSQKFTETHRHGLSVVLRTAAELQKDVGYVQGLNFIVGNLLLMMEHREPLQAQKAALAAFFTFLKQLDMKEFYTEKMLGLKEAIFKFECLLYNEIPEVYLFLMEQNIPVEYFASQWFLTVFQYDIEDVEQSAIIMLMGLVFGQKIFFQIAFQLMLTISSKLCCMSFEQALIYLKDFAGEPQFRSLSFLLEALKNERITNELLSKLSEIYSKMCNKQLNKSPYFKQTPMATRVKFLRGSQPDKVNIKVIWGSSSKQDLLSNSNSLASIQHLHARGSDFAINKRSQEQSHCVSDEESAPVIIEDVPEVINSNRANNLSQKMHGIINYSLERKKNQMGSSEMSNLHQQQIQRTFLQPSKTVLNDLISGSSLDASQKHMVRQKHPNAFLQNPLVYQKEKANLQIQSVDLIQGSTTNPFDVDEKQSLNIKSRKKDKQKMQLSVSIENSIDLMQSVVNEEAVASEDVGVDERNSRHNFGNKELFEQTQRKKQERNLHRYQQESQIEYPHPSQEERALRQTKNSPTRVQGISYMRHKQQSSEIQEAKPSPGALVAGGISAKQHLTGGYPIKIPHSNQQCRATVINQKPIMSIKAQRSPTDAAGSSSDETKDNKKPFGKTDQVEEILETNSEQSPDMHRQEPPLPGHRLPNRPNHQRGGAKGGSLSPNKQKLNMTSGFSSFFLKLNPFAGVRGQAKIQNSIEHSSEQSDLYDETEAFGQTQEDESRPLTHRVPDTDRHRLQRDDTDLVVGNEQGSREPPLFMSPPTAYRRFQMQQLQKLVQNKRNDIKEVQGTSQDIGGSSSHRSPRAFQHALKQSESGQHRKTATNQFNSRQMRYPEAQQKSQLKEEEETQIQSAKKPSQRQKQHFAQVLNLEKLNLSKQSKMSSGKISSKPTWKQGNSKAGSTERSSLINLQPSENIPESEQKEQKVNNISLYGSTNPKNLKMTKKRQDFQLGIPAGLKSQSRDDNLIHTPLLDQLENSGRVDWDEDDMIIRNDKLPKIPITKQTGQLQKGQRQKDKIIRQFKVATKKNSQKLINDARDLDSSPQHLDKQVNILMRRNSQQEMRNFLVRQQYNNGANKSFDEAKEAVAKNNSQVLKESRSQERDTMLSRVTAMGVNSQRPKDQVGLARRQRLFEVVMQSSSGGNSSPTKKSHELLHQENLQEMEGENFADGHIPQANISSYNSHQSSKMMVFNQKFGHQIGYGSGNSNALEETFVISNANNLVIRDELRYSKIQQTQEVELYESNQQPAIGKQRFGELGGGFASSIQQNSSYGKASVQRQSLQVQGHLGDRLHEDQAL